MHQSLGQLAQRDVAVGDKDDTPIPARAAYAAAEAEVLPVDAHTTALAPSCQRHRHGHRHAAVLEAASRVGPLDLEPHLGTDPLREPGGRNQGRAPPRAR